MPTPLQVLANRRNAAKSTGPRSPRGKAIARLNSIRHGIHASLPVLAPGERRSTWDKFAAAILRDLRPLGALETLWAGRIALLQWRLLRCTEQRQTLATQRWREAVITAPQTAWWQFRREKQQALPASIHDLRKNLRLQTMLARLISHNQQPAADNLQPAKLDPDTAVELIEWTADHLNIEDRLTDEWKNGHYPSIRRMSDPNPDRYSWTLPDLHSAFTELGTWADTTLDDLLMTLMPALKAAFNQMRRARDRADREVRRFRRITDARATHESRNIDRYEADLERRLQLAMNELRILQQQRAGKYVTDAGNPPETSAQTRTDSHQTP
jgi:hypothetical protein